VTNLEQAIHAFEKRGEYENAIICGVIYPLQLMLLYGVSEKGALKMDIDDVMKLLNQPPEAGNWDNFWVGGHYHARPSG